MAPPRSPVNSSRSPAVILGAACALVVAVFWASAHSGLIELLGGAASRSHYNLLVEGFQEGRLSLKRAVPPGLALLGDPYDPAANQPYRYAPYVLHDLSYYRGKLYLYFGVTPALLLFWPWAALTGRFLFHRDAAAVFCSVGFLAGAGLIRAIWRRYFPEISVWVAACGVLALGLAASAPILLQRVEVYEVAISGAYAFTTLALCGIWLALHRPAERGRWLASASLALGLAAGARPTALLAAAILIVPVVAACRAKVGQPRLERRGFVRLLVAAAVPFVICGLGLIFYNYLRFNDPFEFGQRYQLATDRQDTAQHFSLSYLWFNFRLYFLEPARWHAGFPYVGIITAPALPRGHGPVEDPFGILACVPVTWLALAAPLAWKVRPAGSRADLRNFLGATALLFLLSAAPILLFYWNCSRYELEFLPAMVLLAVTGIFGVERALDGRRAWRRLARAGWGLALGFSILFGAFAGLERHAEELCQYGNALLAEGQNSSSMAQFRAALRISPGYADAHNGLGVALASAGRRPEAILEIQAALDANPNLPDARTNLGNLLAQTGRVADAVAQYEEVCRIQPASAFAHYNLAYGLRLLGRIDEANQQYEMAVALNPDLARRTP
jgi:tetratricopeptide (TPR) repeat protein